MPPKFPPNQTVALVGIRCDCEPDDLKKVVDGLKKHLGVLTLPRLIKDKSDVGTERDNQRHLVFLNCKSQDDAKTVCTSLNEKQNKDLGIDKYQCVLQAVTKTNLSTLSWDQLAQVEVQTVEGKISQKGKMSCKISDQSITVFVEMEVFEGSDEDWNKLQLGDVLCVTAEKDKGGQVNAEWKAKDAVLVSKASRAVDEKAARKAAETAILDEAGQILDKCLTQNLKGKGWISLQSIGPWFNGDAEVKNALQIVKSKYKQLKNFVAANPIVEMKKEGTDFLIALAADLERERASLGAAEVQKQKEESMLAKSKVQVVEVVTEDETQDEREGRARSYRIQRAILELVPQILGPVLCHAWEQKMRKPWSQGSSGAELLSQVKKQPDMMKRVGKHGLEKVKFGQMSKWDITLFSLLLLDDPGLLPRKSAAAAAVQTLRALRNSFVHELHSKPALAQADFDKEWAQIKKLLGDLTAFVNKPEVQALLESESSKILAERVDAQKEAKYAKEFENMHGDLLKLEDKVGTIQDELAAVKQNMMTASVFDARVMKVAAAMFQQQQSASSPASAAGAASNRAAVQLDTMPGQTFSFVFGPGSPDKLGGGAQGCVYKAKYGTKLVALKVIEPETPAGSNMWQREWQNLKMIKHKNVVKFLGRGTLSHGGQNYDVIGMERVVGFSYDKYLIKEGGKISWSEAAEDFRQIISGMGAVHAKNILHRDLKGANIIRKNGGHIVIVDFGLSKDTTSTMAATATTAGPKGTPAYFSPEAETATPQTPASDVFTMGIILYEILSGYLPWGGDVDSPVRSKLSTLAEGTQSTVYAYILNLQRKPAAPLDQSEAPPSISDFVFKCLALKPQDRFQSAGAMLEPWDRAVEAAKEMVKARSSEAQTFWLQNFGEHESVELDRFKQVVMQSWTIAEDAAQKLASKVDADDSGSIELGEFLKHFSECSMADVARQAQELAQQQKEKAAAEPAGVYSSKPLMREVTFLSKSTSVLSVLGRKKERVGTLTLEAGWVVAKRFDGGRAVPVYSFNVDKSEISVTGESIDLGHAGEKTRNFTFRSKADCDAFAAAFAATKAWQQS